MRLFDVFGFRNVPDQFDPQKIHKHLRKVLGKLREAESNSAKKIKSKPPSRSDADPRKGKLQRKTKSR